MSPGEHGGEHTEVQHAATGQRRGNPQSSQRRRGETRRESCHGECVEEGIIKGVK